MRLRYRWTLKGRRQEHVPSASRKIWLIDLDNTLHDASWRLMGEINHRMTRFVSDRLGLSWAEASALRDRYWHRYGATLLGLIRHHGVSAKEFLRDTHPREDLVSFARRSRGLAAKLQRLPGQRWLVTNAPRDYTHRLLNILGISRSFERLICIDDMWACSQLRPKPSPVLWRCLIRAAGGSAQGLVLVDDSSTNLRVAHRLGIRTARLWASSTQREEGWDCRRPLTTHRPAFVRHQVNSWTSLIRQSGK